MAMVFTEPRALYQTNYIIRKMKRKYLLAGLVVLMILVDIFYGCIRYKVHEGVPPVYVNVAKASFTEHNGVTYVGSTPFSGIMYLLYPTGDTAFTRPYLAGKLQGEVKEWYSNRQMAEDRWYSDGKKNGVHRGWYENGQKKFVAGMKEDHYEGAVKEWYPNGQLYRDFNYKDGQEEGMEKMYWEDGRVRANYQSINGRKYGLTGVKGCRSLWRNTAG